jgi:predicted transcriptional regulator
MQPLQTAKQEALNAIQQLPDNVDLDEIVYRLYVINKIHQGMQDVEAGRTISHEELKREIEQW